jgi:hypothetical protein
MNSPWYILVAVLGVIAWAGVAISWILTRNRRSEPSDAKILERLDSLDARLASVEKTLNEIP